MLGMVWRFVKFFKKEQKTAYLLQKNQEGDIGAQSGWQRALTGDQVETFGSLDGTLLPAGGVHHTDSRRAVIGDNFPVAAGGQIQKASIYLCRTPKHV